MHTRHNENIVIFKLEPTVNRTETVLAIVLCMLIVAVLI